MKQLYVIQMQFHGHWGWTEDSKDLATALDLFDEMVAWEHKPGRRDRMRPEPGHVGRGPTKPHKPRRVRLVLMEIRLPQDGGSMVMKVLKER